MTCPETTFVVVTSRVVVCSLMVALPSSGWLGAPAAAVAR
jgi:hypothetical protein